MGLIDEMKSQIKKSGSSKSKILYLKADTKVRVRFLQELDDGIKIMFHDSFEKGINLPCQLLFDKDCPWCEDDSLRHRDLYIWQVYDYESKEVKLLMGAANKYSPVPQIVSFYDTYGTVLDRDYILEKHGSQLNISYAVVPMDKVKFKIKAKKVAESKVLSILEKAYPTEEETDEKSYKKSKGKNTNSKKKKPEPEEDDEDEEEVEESPKCFGTQFGEKKACKKCSFKKKCEASSDDEDEDEEEADYEDMSAKDLFKLCKEREIKCKPKKDEDYYIELLEEYDEENEEEDEDEEDEW